MKIAKRYLQKGETIYETKTYAGGGHQAMVGGSRRRGEHGRSRWRGAVEKAVGKRPDLEFGVPNLFVPSSIKDRSELPGVLGWVPNSNVEQ